MANRIYKFRAWDNKNKKVTNGFDRRYTLYIGFEGDIDEYCSENDGSREMQSVEDLELMQFTGLKDKNGKEIYEGDIVKIFNWGRANNKVIGIAEIKWDVDELGWRIEPTFDIDTYDLIEKALYYCEVIGNIYENKELLEAQNDTK